MNAKVFIDTNILVYAHDLDAGTKHQAAQNLISHLAQERTGILSMQVLQEFYVAATRKLTKPLPRAEARAIIEDFGHWCVPTSPSEVRDAFRIEDEARISFWDAMIVAAAVRGGASRIYSEDLNSGQTIGGILIENPFLS